MKSFYLMPVCLVLNLSHAQVVGGLKFSDQHEGTVLMSEAIGSNNYEVNIYGEASKKMYEMLQRDPKSQKLIGRNAQGENKTTIYRNNGLECETLNDSGVFSCRFEVQHQGGIAACKGKEKNPTQFEKTKSTHIK